LFNIFFKEIAFRPTKLLAGIEFFLF